MYRVYYPNSKSKCQACHHLPDFVRDKVAIFRVFFLNNGIYHPIASLYNQAYKPCCRRNITRNCQPEDTQTLQKPTISLEIKSFAITQNFVVFSGIKFTELLRTPQGQSLRCVNM